MDIYEYSCKNCCFGQQGYDGSCCSLENRDWIMGPVTDPYETLKRISEDQGVSLQYSDLFVDYEEGSKMFPDKPVWQDKNNYPAMRVDPTIDKRPCVCYDVEDKTCKIYESRPQMCREFNCDFLKNLSEMVNLPL